MKASRILVAALLAALALGVAAAYAYHARKPSQTPLGVNHYAEPAPLKPHPHPDHPHPEHHPEPGDERGCNECNPNTPRGKEAHPPATPARLDALLWRLYAKVSSVYEAAKSLEKKGLPASYMEVVREAVRAYNQAVDAAEKSDTRLAYAWAHIADAAADAALHLLRSWAAATNTTALPPKITG